MDREEATMLAAGEDTQERKSSKKKKKNKEKKASRRVSSATATSTELEASTATFPTNNRGALAASYQKPSPVQGIESPSKKKKKKKEKKAKKAKDKKKPVPGVAVAQHSAAEPLFEEDPNHSNRSNSEIFEQQQVNDVPAQLKPDADDLSQRSDESSIFSSYPTNVKPPAWKSDGIGDSMLNDEESVGVGMAGKSDEISAIGHDDDATWASFRIGDLDQTSFAGGFASFAAKPGGGVDRVPKAINGGKTDKSWLPTESPKAFLPEQQLNDVIMGRLNDIGEDQESRNSASMASRDSFASKSRHSRQSHQSHASSDGRGNASHYTKSSGSTPLVGNGVPTRTTRSTNPPVPTHISESMAEKAREASGGARAPTSMDSGDNLRSVSSFPSQISQMDSNNSSDDMLMRYLQSMGTNPETAGTIVANFRQQQLRGSAAAARSVAGSTNTGDSRSRNSETQEARRAERQRRRRQRAPNLMWERASRPGAVQMAGRAFGAPSRPDTLSPALHLAENSDDDDAQYVQAMAVKAVTSAPVVYADTSPLSFQVLIKEKSIRRRLMMFACLVVVVIIIIVSVVVVKSKDDNGGDAIFEPTVSPSLAPTLISDEVLERAEFLSGSDIVRTPGTPQHDAVGWMSTFDDLEDGLGDNFDQRYAMIVFFFSLDGENWLERENWLNPELHECLWAPGKSIFCVADGTGGFLVNGIDLTRNGLVGVLPHELYLLPNLVSLRLSKNTISGSLPISLLQLPNLQTLSLDSNSMSGAIPDNFTANDLSFLDLSQNSFTGSIPQSFYSLKVLRIAQLSDNMLSGTISVALADLKDLSRINIANNQVSGTLPAFDPENLPSFDNLDMGNNLLSGTLPQWVLELLTRQELIMNNNKLTGTLPQLDAGPALELLYSDPEALRLRNIDLSHNEFIGPVPTWASFLPNMKNVDLSHNSFTGSVPPFGELFGAPIWQSLESLHLSHNKLTGTLSAVLPTLLQVLDLSNNLLSGSIPEAFNVHQVLEYVILDNNPQLSADVTTLLRDSLDLKTLSVSGTSVNGSLAGADVSKLSRMEVLSLSKNNISGTIPTEFGDLVLLKKLFLDSNQITGSIVSDLGRLDNVLSLHLDNNMLTGSIPDEIGQLENLENFTVFGNDGLTGTLPRSFCQENQNRSAEDIGCQVECSCCENSEQICGSNPSSSGRTLRGKRQSLG